MLKTYCTKVAYCLIIRFSLSKSQLNGFSALSLGLMGHFHWTEKLNYRTRTEVKTTKCIHKKIKVFFDVMNFACHCKALGPPNSVIKFLTPAFMLTPNLQGKNWFYILYSVDNSINKTLNSYFIKTSVLLLKR